MASSQRLGELAGYGIRTVLTDLGNYLSSPPVAKRPLFENLQPVGTLMLKPKIASGLVLVVFLASPIVAFGALLNGKTVEYQYFYPTNTTPYSSADNGNKVVGPGIEVTNIADNDGTLDISDTNLFVAYTGSSTWSTASFNGFRIRDVFGTINAFTGVTVNPATTMVGFNASRITFDANQIWVNWNGLDFNPNTIVSLDIQSIPEPSTLLLAAVAVVGFGWRRRSR